VRMPLTGYDRHAERIGRLDRPTAPRRRNFKLTYYPLSHVQNHAAAVTPAARGVKPATGRTGTGG
jgi:hypothetical protein